MRSNVCKQIRLFVFCITPYRWISLYRDIFLILYRHLKFSISPSTNLLFLLLYAITSLVLRRKNILGVY